MREEDLELLVTLDDPEGAPEEDTFNHIQAQNLEYWLRREQHDEQPKTDSQKE